MVFSAVFLIKVYTLGLLYLLFLKTELTSDYRAFVFLQNGKPREQRMEEVRQRFLERLAPYDGQFYLDIASNAYRRFEQTLHGQLSGQTVLEGNYAFFPLFPILLRVVHAPSSRAGIVLALLSNMILATAGTTGLWLLARKLKIPPWPTLFFMVTFPMAVFQSVLYTESLFLFLSIAFALSLVYEQKLGAILFGYLGGLCRPQGILLSVLPLPLGRRGRSFQASNEGSGTLLRLLAGSAPVAGILTFALILAAELHSPLAFLKIQGSWGRGLSLGGALREIFVGNYQGPVVDLVGLVFGLLLIPFLWRHLPTWLAFYGTATVLLPLSTGTVLSFGRFVSVSFPHFLCLAKLFESWKIGSFALISGFLILQTIVAKGLVGWFFVG